MSQSTSRNETHPVQAYRTTERGSGDGPPSVDTIRAHLVNAAKQLRRIEAGLQKMVSEVPKSGDFNIANELRDAADCVCRDLLTDAIETLQAVADANEAELRRCHEERRQWPAA